MAKQRWYKVETLIYPKRPRGRLVFTTSQKKAIEEIMKSPIVYDKRYWGMEVYAYSVNGEDF